ncbi:MAG: tetratricopeptide repeat protein [Bacteroidota bacterium]
MTTTLKNTSTSFFQRKQVYTMLFLLLGFSFAASAQRRKEQKTDSLKERQSMEARMQFFNGIKEKNNSQFDLAVEAFRKSAALDPANDAAYYEISRINIQNGNLVEAQVNAKRALEISGNNIYYKALNADISLQLGQTKDALKLYQSIIAQDPENVDAYLSIATIYEAQKNYSEANKYYSLVESRTGVVYEIVQQKINNYITARDFGKAIDEVKVLIKNYPDQTEFKIILADLYGYNNQEELAIRTLNDIVKEDPDAAAANLKLAKVALSKKEYAKSIGFAKTAFLSKEQPIDTKMELMFIYFDASNQQPELMAEIEDLAQTLTMVHSDDAKSFAVYGDVLNTRNKYELARTQYRKAVVIAPSKHLIWQEILSIDGRLSDFDALISDSEKGLSLFPNMPIFYYFSGVGLAQKKEYQKAIESLEAGVALVIDDKQVEGQFRASLGDAYNGTGNNKKSDENYDKALKLNPNDTYVLNNYSYFLSLRGEKLDKAKQMAEHVNQLIPNQPSYQDTYAWVLYKMKNYTEAKIWLDKAIAGGGKSGEIFEHYGDVQFQLGNTDSALEYWKKAQETGGTSALIGKKIADKKLVE